MKKYILETLLQEAVKISRQGEVKDMPLVDLVQQVLEQTNESEVLTQAENDALIELRRMDPISQQPSIIPEPTLDQQIEFVKRQIGYYQEMEKPNVGRSLGQAYRSQMFNSIATNLKGIKRWNETPVYHNVDVVKVIEDLVKDLQTAVGLGGENPNLVVSIQNAEAAIGMINAFKQQRHE